MKKTLSNMFFAAIFLLIPFYTYAVDSQWASKVIDFSSQYGIDSWSANQVLDKPNTKNYGDNILAWTPNSSDGGKEFLSLGFNTPFYVTGVTIRETYGYGFVTAVDFIDTNNVVHEGWKGRDNSKPSQINNFYVSVPQTTYLVKGVIIHMDTALHSGWEEVDAIQLHGIPTLRGTIAPHFEHTATLECVNITSGQSVSKTIKGSGQSDPVVKWDCENAGLKFNPGDTVSFQVTGVIAE